MKYFFKAFQLMGIVSNWAAGAMADGKVTASEGFQLLTQLAGLLGLQLEWDLPGDVPAPVPAPGVTFKEKV